MANALAHSRLGGGTEELLLHQALHGYADGHRLVGASISIPDDLTRLMLRMSDLSGSSTVAGFQDYLTGYPLTSLDAYALAKTWYASEMMRPGCVWTHTLVIPASVMAQIPSLSSLTPLFRRPNGQSVSDDYSKPISFSPEPGVRSCEWDLDRTLETQTFLSAHYQKGSPPVIIPAADSNEFAGLIFAAWSQKWPALRMRFTFCTGSLSNRMIEKHPLDVQCVPTISTRVVTREVAEAGLGAPVVMQVAPVDFPRWTVLAANDALQCEGGPVRGFLWSVADEDSTPADFESCVKVYDGLDQSVPFSSIVELTADLFPRPSDGRRLKRVVFGDQKATAIPPVDSKDKLFAIATTHHIGSFDAQELSLTDQASLFQENQPALGCLLIMDLFRASLNPIGEQILSSLILAARPDDALVFASDQKQFLPTLFRVNPRLATSAGLWRAAGDRKRELFESLVAQPSVEPETVRGIVSALLDSGSDGFLGQAFAKWGRVAVAHALDWCEAHDGSMSESCRRALTFHLADVMDWVTTSRERSTAMLVAAAHVVAPYSNQIAHYDATVWLLALHVLRENHQEEETNYISAFLLALALCNAPPAPLGLASESFERVHQLAGKEQLRDDAWFILQPLVPELSWRKNWDKCERLRRALLERFIRNRWPLQELLRCVSEATTLRSVLYSCREIHGGEDFICSVAEGVLSGSLSATEAQRTSFQQSFRRNRRGDLKLDL